MNNSIPIAKKDDTLESITDTSWCSFKYKDFIVCLNNFCSLKVSQIKYSEFKHQKKLFLLDTVNTNKLNEITLYNCR